MRAYSKSNYKLDFTLSFSCYTISSFLVPQYSIRFHSLYPYCQCASVCLNDISEILQMNWILPHCTVRIESKEISYWKNIKKRQKKVQSGEKLRWQIFLSREKMKFVFFFIWLFFPLSQFLILFPFFRQWAQIIVKWFIVMRRDV